MSISQDFLKFKNSQTFIMPDDIVLGVFQPVLEDIRKCGHTEYVLTGGRGSTKSSFAAEGCFEKFMNNPKIHWLVCRQVQDTLKDSVYAQIAWVIDKLGLNDEFEFKKSPLEIIRKSTRQIIYFRGADDPMKIKSIKPPFGYIGILWFEELDQFKGDDAVRSIEQSAIRGGDNALIMKSFNPPKSGMNWANKYVRMPKDTRLITHNSYLDVPREWLGETFISEAEYLRDTNPTAYEHEYMGVANGTGGAVFENVTIRRITPDEVKSFDHVYRGLDWGWFPDPNRFVEVNYNAGRQTLYIFGEISCNKTSNEQMEKKLLDYGITRSDEITADNSDKKSIGDFRSWGYRMRPAQKGPGSVETGIKWLCSLREIIIDNRRCPETAKEFLEYEYERDKNGDVISGYPDMNNHSIDAVRYALEKVIRRRGGGR